MILVIGATGTSGREVVWQLADRGERVRAMVRDPGRAVDLGVPNVEVVAGDLDQPASIDAALNGVDRAFFVSAVDERYPQRFGNFLDAARRAGSPHVVKFSGMGATPDAPSVILRQHAETDDALAASGLPFTVLRPNSFHQNMLWLAETIRDQSTFHLPLRDARVSLVDVRDIAVVAALVLTGAGHEGKTYEITGPEALSFADVAAALSDALGRPVRYLDVPPEAALDSMLKAGMPAWNARAVVELYGEFAAGKAARVTDAVERLTGHPPIPFARFARDHAAAFS
jgi:uncharacterized protein YbjT (DUF2867 family)